MEDSLNPLINYPPPESVFSNNEKNKIDYSALVKYYEKRAFQTEQDVASIQKELDSADFVIIEMRTSLGKKEKLINELQLRLNKSELREKEAEENAKLFQEEIDEKEKKLKDLQMLTESLEKNVSRLENEVKNLLFIINNQ